MNNLSYEQGLSSLQLESLSSRRDINDIIMVLKLLKNFLCYPKNVFLHTIAIAQEGINIRSNGKFCPLL